MAFKAIYRDDLGRIRLLGAGQVLVDDAGTAITNATHTGEVTGSGALVVNPLAVTNKVTGTPIAGDFLLYSDTVSGSLKKVDASDLLGGGGSGDVVGPATSVDANLPQFSGTTGKLIADSGIAAADIAANTAKVTNATHTGEVTGSGALTVDPTAVTNKTAGTPVAGDFLLYSDTVGGGLKKVDASALLGGGGGSGDVVGPASAVNENIAVFDLTTGKLIKDGLISKADVIANTAKVTNATHSGHMVGATVLTLQKEAITDQTLVTAVGADTILIVDATDGLLKKALLSDIAGGASTKLPITLSYGATGVVASDSFNMGITAGGVTQYKAGANGSIRSTQIGVSTTRTAGTIVITPKINGVAVAASGQATIDAANPDNDVSKNASGVITFLAGDIITLDMTADSSWLPTADVSAILVIEEDS